MSTGDSFSTWPPRDPYGPRQQPPRRQPASSPWLVPALILLTLASLALSGTLVWRDYVGRSGLDSEPRAVTPRGDLAADEKTTIEIYNQTRPSVVHITSMANRRDSLTLNVQQVPEGTGTGFIWDDDGHIVTNFHVIRNADAAVVTLWDQTSWKARTVGAYADKDLAVLQIDAPRAKLKKILVGRSDDLQVGQKVFAIGNPFGLDQTLTTGIISALGREIESVSKRPIQNMIQTDAPINPGNSGGPLLDSAGRLIGVNTAIFSPSGASVGIGFAIPVDEVNRVVPQLVRNGKVTRPGLGIQIATDQLAQELKKDGVLIIKVQPDSPAEKAGLRPTKRDPSTASIILGDVIVAIDGKEIKKTHDLFTTLDARKVGDTVTVTVERDGKKTDVPVTLAPVE
jgi:S1-C subfamily serine protease